MKKNDLIKVIREIVKQELKKELPNALAQVFSNLMGDQRPAVHSINTVRYINPPVNAVGKQYPHTPSQVEIPDEVPTEIDEMSSLKSQLTEMFNNGTPVKRNAQPQASVPPAKQFTSNPVLNEVLNQTRPFNSSERMAMRAGGGAGLAMSPAVAIAAAGFQGSSPAQAVTGVGEMMPEEEVGFMRNIPTMPGANSPVLTELPVHAQSGLREGQEGGSAPLEGMQIDSALDLKIILPYQTALKEF